MIAPKRNKPSPTKRVAALFLLAATAFAALKTNEYYNNYFSFIPWAKKKPIPTPLLNATPTVDLIQLPIGCKHRITPIVKVVNFIMTNHFKHMKLPTPVETQKVRKMLVHQTGTSMVLYNKSILDVGIKQLEMATCWIPGPAGNFFWPDSILVRMYHFRLSVHMLYQIEQNVFGHNVQLGGGDMTTEVEGVLIMELDMHDMNNTVRRCEGIFGMKSLVATGAINTMQEAENPLTDEEMSHEVCWGPTYWDYELSGPRTRGMADEVNLEIRKRYFEGYVAPPPSPPPLPPPYSCSCEWTSAWACPGDLPGKKGTAKDDNSACFEFCCPSPPHPPSPPPPPPPDFPFGFGDTYG